MRLIKVIVAPLIFGTLVTGISGHGNLRSVGRIGLKSLIYFEVVTTLALFLGVAAINISRAGEGLAISQTAVAPPQNTAPLRWDDFLLHIFPENIAKSVAENQILQVAVFAVLFGIALARVSETKRAPMLKLCESLTETMFSFTNLVMYFAPVGVGAAMAYTVGHLGIGVLLPLGKLLLTGYCALDCVLAADPVADRAAGATAAWAIRQGRGRACNHRICYERLRSGAAPRHGSDGGLRRAAAHCCVRHSRRLQLQFGRLDVCTSRWRRYLWRKQRACTWDGRSNC